MSCVDAGPAEGARLLCRTIESPRRENAIATGLPISDDFLRTRGRAQNRTERDPGSDAGRRPKCGEVTGNRRPLAASSSGCGGAQPSELEFCWATARASRADRSLGDPEPEERPEETDRNGKSWRPRRRRADTLRAPFDRTRNRYCLTTVTVSRPGDVCPNTPGVAPA